MLAGDVEGMVIAGMGGRTIVEILAGLAGWSGWAVVQPQQDADVVLDALEAGWSIQAAAEIAERRTYSCWRARR